MLDRFARLLNVSTTVAAIVLALAVVQLATQAFALIDLARRDVVFGGRKWIWALIIALGNLPGAVGYLFAGRPASEANGTSGGSRGSAACSDAARRAVDVLYNSDDRR
jgi:hypothetical protein